MSPELTTSYLLGELAPDARQRLEETLMVDEHYYEELLIAEEELIDRYLSGGLDKDEQERFLKHFLITPGRRQKLDFARTFRAYASSHAPRPSGAEGDGQESPSGWLRQVPFLTGGYSPALRLTFAASVLLLVLAGSWVIWNRWPRPDPSRRAGQNVLIVSLVPVSTRSDEETKRIVIPPEVLTVRLRLEPAVLGQESYSAKILTDEGAEIFRADALSAEGDGSVVVMLPAESLVAGDYSLKLDGSKGGAKEGAGTYHFRVTGQ